MFVTLHIWGTVTCLLHYTFEVLSHVCYTTHLRYCHMFVTLHIWGTVTCLLHYTLEVLSHVCYTTHLRYCHMFVTLHIWGTVTCLLHYTFEVLSHVCYTTHLRYCHMFVTLHIWGTVTCLLHYTFEVLSHVCYTTHLRYCHMFVTLHIWGTVTCLLHYTFEVLSHVCYTTHLRYCHMFVTLHIWGTVTCLLHYTFEVLSHVCYTTHLRYCHMFVTLHIWGEWAHLQGKQLWHSHLCLPFWLWSTLNGKNFLPYRWMSGWLCEFTSVLTVYQVISGWCWMIMKGCVQWNSVFGWEDFTSSEDRTQSARSVGQHLAHWDTGASISSCRSMTLAPWFHKKQLLLLVCLARWLNQVLYLTGINFKLEEKFSLYSWSQEGG